MCGIFGSSNFSKFVSLYDINKQRGYFSFGMLSVDSTNKSIYICKKPGEVDLEHLPSHIESNHDLYLGHSQAPTSAERNFKTATSHPFEFGSWVVAHNGIINNFKDLKQQYRKTHRNKVDSSILPVMLDINNTSDSLTECLIKTFSDVKGLVGAWCHEKNTNRTFLVRMGSTLHISNTDHSFSSLPLPGLTAADDHTIYEIKDKHITECTKIKNNTSFFTID